ncbi:MAG: hypothetical protein QM765_20920 [Myxococcales bacterium]
MRRTRIVLHEVTVAVSSTHSGSRETLSSVIAASSSATFFRRSPLAFSSTCCTQRSYASALSKSRLPRIRRCCSSRRFAAPLSASTSPFWLLLPTSIVRGFIPRWSINCWYSALKPRLPSATLWVAAVELSVW